MFLKGLYWYELLGLIVGIIFLLIPIGIGVYMLITSIIDNIKLKKRKG